MISFENAAAYPELAPWPRSSAPQGLILLLQGQQFPLQLANSLVSYTFYINLFSATTCVCNTQHPLYEKKPAEIFHRRYQQQHFKDAPGSHMDIFEVKLNFCVDYPRAGLLWPISLHS